MSQTEVQLIKDSAVVTADIADQAVTLDKLPHGTGSNDGKFLRANNGADPTFETVTGTTVNSNADNRVITGSDTANTLNGEADLTFDGNDLTINKTGGDSDVIIKTTTSGNPTLKFNASGAGGHEIGFDRSNTALTFTTTGSSERMRLDSSGNLLIGTSTSALVGGGAACLYQVETTSQNAISCVAHRGTSSASGSIFILGKSRGTAAGSTTAVASGDELGALRFAGADGTDIQSRGGEVSCEVDGTPGSNDMPGRLLFKTTADGSAAPTERVRIASDGRVGIGTSSPAANVHVHTDSNGEGVLIKSTGNTSNALTFDANRGTGGVIGVAYGRWNGTTVAQMSFVSGDDGTDKNDGVITFGTESAASNGNVNATERLRIQSGGGISFNGDTAAANALDDYEEGTWTPADASGAGPSISASSNRYTKIGRMVFACGRMQFGASGSGATAKITLPFTPDSNITSSAVGSACFEQSYDSNNTVMACINDTAGVIFRKNGSGNLANDQVGGTVLRFCVYYMTA